MALRRTFPAHSPTFEVCFRRLFDLPALAVYDPNSR